MKKALFLVFIILLCSLVLGSSVTRTMSSSIVEGSDLFVTITATITSPDTIIAIDEIIPSGFSIKDANGGDSGQTRHLQWIEEEASGTIVYKYKVNVGNTPGTYTFSGKYVAENDTVEKTISGTTQVSVTALVPICTEEHWTDTNSACRPDNTLTTTWTHTTCQGGVQHTSPQEQFCNYNAPTCWFFDYDDWGTCSSAGFQSRSLKSSLPENCQGGNPQLTQPCTYVPTCTAENWSDTNGICQSNNTKTRTWEKIIPCENGVDHNPLIETIYCNYNAPICSSFTYFSFGECKQVFGTTGIRSRTIATQLPLGCEGGNPQLNEDCNFVPTCTDSHWTYSLGPCDNNTQIKTWTKTADCNGGVFRPTTEEIYCTPNLPPTPYCGNDDWTSRIEPEVCPSTGMQIKYWTKNKDCQGGITKAPQETITCNIEQPIPTCTSFTYSDWGVCSPQGNQTRNITSSSPSGCNGGSPTTTQSCTFINQDNNVFCEGIYQQEKGVCCNGIWNAKIDSCEYDIDDIIVSIEETSDGEAILLIELAQTSINAGEVAKGKAQAQLALLKSKLKSNPGYTIEYENALVALNAGKYYESEQLSINALSDIEDGQANLIFNDSLIQIILAIIVLAIIVIGIIFIGAKKGPGSKEPRRQYLSEKEELLKNLKEEFG